MAVHTSPDLRHLNIYSIFVRNFTTAGTLNAIHTELDRIKHLGTDAVLFMPFYPIGEVNRIGLMGSPYAVKEHSKIDPNVGTLDDFKLLVKEIHKREMKVIIEVVMNHTSPDSELVNEHPEWFHTTSSGFFTNRYGDSQDVIDLDYTKRELWLYQLEVLKAWAEIVDGFHCHFAPVIPLKFWRLVKREINKIKSNFVWIAHGFEKNAISHLRNQQILAHSDSELYQVFDITYAYDVLDEFMDYLHGKIPLSKYVYALNLQETTYPWNYVKLQFLETNTVERVTGYLDNIDNLIQWTAFKFLQKGSILITCGQEVASDKKLNLFEKDPIEWETGIDLSSFIAHLSYLEKKYIPVINVKYYLEAYDALDTVIIYYSDDVEKRVGIFNLKHQIGKVPVDVPDGVYDDLIRQQPFYIKNGKVDLQNTPLFFIYK